MARKTDVQTLTVHSKITFKNVLENFGGGYDRTTSTFRCPDESVYVFTASVLSRAGGATYFAIVQDGAPKGSGYTGLASGHSSATETAVIKCHRGSRVWVMCHSSYNQSNMKAWHHSYFSGFRV